jgi:hypothetical protein
VVKVREEIMAKVHLTERTFEALRKIQGGVREDSEIGLEQSTLLRRLEFAVGGGNSGQPLTLTTAGEAALEQVKVVKEQKDMAKTKATGKGRLDRRDQEMSKKYPHYVAGSIKTKAGESKLTCQIRCTECAAHRACFTSDVFQIKVCVACRDKRIARGTVKGRESAKAAKKAKGKAFKPTRREAATPAAS